jgi:hypothetical protein
MPIPGFVQFAPDGSPEAVAQRNQGRLPAYSRLDFRANKAFSFERYKLTLSGELLNAMDHANYFFLGEDPMRIQNVNDFAAQEKTSVPILSGAFAFQDTRIDIWNVFGFLDTTDTLGMSTR